MKVSVCVKDGLNILDHAKDNGIFEQKEETKEQHDSRLFVSMFEFNSLKQQLREALQERTAMQRQIVKAKNDINSISKLVKSRLFTKLGIPEETLQEVCNKECRGSSLKHKIEENNLLSDENIKIEENKSEKFEMVPEAQHEITDEERSSKIYVDKSQYLNASGFLEIDNLAKEVFVLFHKIADFISYHNIDEDLLDFELDTKDKVGFAITGNRASFGEGKSKEAIYEAFENTKTKTIVKSNEKATANGCHGGNSLQMTTVLSNSKIVNLNENLARDYTQRNLIKQKVRAKWIPNEHASKCFNCCKSFGLIRWKHHCRECGNVFCGFCCNRYEYASGFEDQKVRICNNCMNRKVSREKGQANVKRTSIFSGRFHNLF